MRDLTHWIPVAKKTPPDGIKIRVLTPWLTEYEAIFSTIEGRQVWFRLDGLGNTLPAVAYWRPNDTEK